MTPSSKEIIDATKEILSQPEFLQKQVDKDFIHRFLDWLFTSMPQEFWVIFILSILALGGVFLIWILLVSFRNRKVNAEAKLQPVNSNPQEDIKQSPEGRIPTSSIQDLHAHFLNLLASRKLILPKKWKTNSHYHLECQPKNSALACILRDLNHDFDQCVFGKHCLPLERIEYHVHKIEEEIRNEKK